MLNIFENTFLILKLQKLFGVVTLSFIYGLSILIALPAYSSQALYSLKNNQNFVQQGLGLDQRNSQTANVHFDDTTITRLNHGVLIDVPLPGGKVATGRVIKSDTNSAPSRTAAAFSQFQKTIVSLDNNAGSVEITSANNSITKMMLHDVDAEKIYTADINANGDGLLSAQDNNDYYCVKYPQTDLLNPFAQQAPQVAALIPDISTLRNLQSRPGSANVLYIDYWGGSLTNSYWNANYTSNAPINYTPYDTDSNPGNFSASERYSMWLAWREAVEDFAPFNINITTSRAVYDAAATVNRAQMIVTTTQSWYSNNAGGVALVNIFKNNSESTKAAWTWNLGNSSMGMTISHEAGHQLGLGHDGIGTQSYYTGHGVWGPIMGAPFGQPYVQWSKGEYPNANQTEDDIAKVSGKLGLIADDAGNGYSNATNLNLPVNNKKGLLAYQDTDAYKFTLSTGGSVEIKVIPLLGDEDESRAANLSMDVSLVKINAGGGVISNISMIRSSDNSPLSPLTNTFVYSGDVTAGTYALRITPSSPNTNLATGFGNYGNAGEYRLSVSAMTDGNINTIGAPAINRSTDVGLFIWENSPNNWELNFVSGGASRSIEVDVVSQQSLSNVLPLSIESNDSFTLQSNRIDMQLNVSPPWADGVRFTVQGQSATCVSTTSSTVPVYLGPDRVQMPAAFDLSTLAGCDSSAINTIGEPAINRSTDVGLFIWENSPNIWELNFVSGGASRSIEVDVVSQQSLSNVLPLSIESNDSFTLQSNRIDMQLNVSPPWADGVRFTVQGQSATCVSTTSSTVPVYLGPDRVQMPTAFDLSTLAGCDSSAINTIGEPAINRSTDVGLFIWENSPNIWELNFVSGGASRSIEVDVVSQQSLSNVLPLSIESNDGFTLQSNRLDMQLNVSPPWADGVRFTVQGQSGTCVSTTSSTVPIYLGPDRINVSNAINLDTLSSCQ